MHIFCLITSKRVCVNENTKNKSSKEQKMKLLCVVVAIIKSQIVTEIRSRTPDGFDDYDELDCEDAEYVKGLSTQS